LDTGPDELIDVELIKNFNEPRDAMVALLAAVKSSRRRPSACANIERHA